ncbi:MAG: hypothetical protein R3F31_19765 [Verrucomicrobiales bacterium]
MTGVDIFCQHFLHRHAFPAHVDAAEGFKKFPTLVTAGLDGMAEDLPEDLGLGRIGGAHRECRNRQAVEFRRKSPENGGKEAVESPQKKPGHSLHKHFEELPVIRRFQSVQRLMERIPFRRAQAGGILVAGGSAGQLPQDGLEELSGCFAGEREGYDPLRFWLEPAFPVQRHQRDVAVRQLVGLSRTRGSESFHE